MFSAALVLLRPFLLPLALVVALAGNAWQWRAAAVDEALVEADRVAQRDLGKEIGRREAAEDRAERAAAAADMAHADAIWMLGELERITHGARERVTVYRDRVQLLPPAGCAPGQDRIDAINELLQ